MAQKTANEKKGKLCKHQSLLAPNWRGAIADDDDEDDDDYLMGRRNHKSASTNNFVCPTLPSLLSLSHASYSYAAPASANLFEARLKNF